jgi:hypothetical protein
MEGFLVFLSIHFYGEGGSVIHTCARRTSTFLSCAFREQEDDQATLSILLRPRVARAPGYSILFYPLHEGGRGSPSTARIERAPSERARSASKEGDHVCPHPLLIHANNFINRFFVPGEKCALRHWFTTFLFTSAWVG